MKSIALPDRPVHINPISLECSTCGKASHFSPSKDPPTDQITEPRSRSIYQLQEKAPTLSGHAAVDFVGVGTNRSERGVARVVVPHPILQCKAQQPALLGSSSVPSACNLSSVMLGTCCVVDTWSPWALPTCLESDILAEEVEISTTDQYLQKTYYPINKCVQESHYSTPLPLIPPKEGCRFRGPCGHGNVGIPSGIGDLCLCSPAAKPHEFVFC